MTVRAAIAERRLLFARNGAEERKPLVIRICAPYALKEGMVNFLFDAGAAGCTIEFDGIDEPSVEVHGIDSLHALALATDIDPILRGLGRKYDFFWVSGEAYFES